MWACIKLIWPASSSSGLHQAHLACIKLIWPASSSSGLHRDCLSCYTTVVLVKGLPIAHNQMIGAGQIIDACRTRPRTTAIVVPHEPCRYQTRPRHRNCGVRVLVHPGRKPLVANITHFLGAAAGAVPLLRPLPQPLLMLRLGGGGEGSRRSRWQEQVAGAGGRSRWQEEVAGGGGRRRWQEEVAGGGGRRRWRGRSGWQERVAGTGGRSGWQERVAGAGGSGAAGAAAGGEGVCDEQVGGV
ncbi:unnamed protein product [Closterium sp. NIES-65]|nr:unnamed protein product [Closterium sp. NIES-65]